MADGPAHGIAYGRAALAGNPSDSYGGAVLAVTIERFCAEARARTAPALSVDPPSELVLATARRFARKLRPDALATEVRWTTSIPKGVGLGGSSAIVIATLRALCGLYEVQLEPAALATLALAVEREELGIAAGLQDRVAQAYGGLTFMDFGEQGHYEALDRGLLPPLLVAWRADAAQESGEVHRSLRDRYERGERSVVSAMRELATLATDARAALGEHDHDRFARSVDGSLDVRGRLIALDARHVEMVSCARALRASANYTGSGGAIVAVCRDEEHRATVGDALRRLASGAVAL